jgi:hypothetical protein
MFVLGTLSLSIPLSLLLSFPSLYVGLYSLFVSLCLHTNSKERTRKCGFPYNEHADSFSDQLHTLRVRPARRSVTIRRQFHSVRRHRVAKDV